MPRRIDDPNKNVMGMNLCLGELEVSKDNRSFAEVREPKKSLLSNTAELVMIPMMASLLAIMKTVLRSLSGDVNSPYPSPPAISL